MLGGDRLNNISRSVIFGTLFNPRTQSQNLLGSEWFAIQRHVRFLTGDALNQRTLIGLSGGQRSACFTTFQQLSNGHDGQPAFPFAIKVTPGTSPLQNRTNSAVIADFLLSCSGILGSRLSRLHTTIRKHKASSDTQSKNNGQPDSHKDHTDENGKEGFWRDSIE